MKHLISAAALALLAACSPPAEPRPEAPAAETAAPAPSIEGIPAGAYTLDKSHASLVFRVSHLGFSTYTAEFSDFDAQLQLDPAKPATAALTATVNPRSLDIPAPPAGFLRELLGPQWLNAAAHPRITFQSTRIEVTGANTARIHGDLTLLGVTKPIVLDATYNGGWAGIPQDPHARIGFSARGSFNRSDFGLSIGVPPPGSTMGVGDSIEVQIETEFSGPPMQAAPAP
ncbi:MAG: YceI family protein [Hyphomonadaceae bacterium]|nr:YceI family protein [Hyphomonadaceae bacterium]